MQRRAEVDSLSAASQDSTMVRNVGCFDSSDASSCNSVGKFFVANSNAGTWEAGSNRQDEDEDASFGDTDSTSSVASGTGCVLTPIMHEAFSFLPQLKLRSELDAKDLFRWRPIDQEVAKKRWRQEVDFAGSCRSFAEAADSQLDGYASHAVEEGGLAASRVIERVAPYGLSRRLRARLVSGCLCQWLMRLRPPLLPSASAVAIADSSNSPDEALNLAIAAVESLDGLRRHAIGHLISGLKAATPANRSLTSNVFGHVRRVLLGGQVLRSREANDRLEAAIGSLLDNSRRLDEIGCSECRYCLRPGAIVRPNGSVRLSPVFHQMVSILQLRCIASRGLFRIVRSREALNTERQLYDRLMRGSPLSLAAGLHLTDAEAGAYSNAFCRYLCSLRDAFVPVGQLQNWRLTLEDIVDKLYDERKCQELAEALLEQLPQQTKYYIGHLYSLREKILQHSALNGLTEYAVDVRFAETFFPGGGVDAKDVEASQAALTLVIVMMNSCHSLIRQFTVCDGCRPA